MGKGFQKGQGIGRGNKKGYIPWNKGRKETRISVLKNQSDSHIGKKFSQETIEKMRGRVGEKNSYIVNPDQTVDFNPDEMFKFAEDMEDDEEWR